MSALPNPLISREEYLRTERIAPFQSESRGGRLVAMAGTTRDHSRIVTNITSTLHSQLRDCCCNNYSTGLRVGVRSGDRYLHPDAVVTCGEEIFEDGQLDTLVNLVVVIEVLSPSTEAHDRGEISRLSVDRDAQGISVDHALVPAVRNLPTPGRRCMTLSILGILAGSAHARIHRLHACARGRLLQSQH